MDFVPGVGFWEIILIATIAFLVVGPKDLPLMMRKAGRLLAKVRAMASDFRASFDEMARQAELEELRREVDALRQEAQRPIIPPYSDPSRSFQAREGVPSADQGVADAACVTMPEEPAAEPQPGRRDGLEQPRPAQESAVRP